MNRASKILFAGSFALVGAASLYIYFEAPKGTFGGTPPCFELGEPFHHRYRPGCEGEFRVRAGHSVTYSINEEGLRERPLEKLPAGPKILLLGDSDVEGHGLSFSETLSQQLESLRGGAVVNGGIRFAGPIFEYRRLKELLGKIQIQELIWVLCENDPSDDRLFRALGTSFDTDSLPTAFSLEDFRTGTLPVPTASSVPVVREVLSLIRFRYYQAISKRIAARVPENAELSCKALEKGAALARKTGARVTFLLLPLGPNFPDPKAAQDFEKLANCIPKEARVLDMRKELKDRADLFAHGDHHPNAAGARKIATTLHRFLAPPPALFPR